MKGLCVKNLNSMSKHELNTYLRSIYTRTPFRPHWDEVDRVHAQLFIVNKGQSFSHGQA